MELRYWLVIICLLAIVLIFLDGWRRWKARHRYHGTFTQTADELSDFPSTELPAGGARVRQMTPQEIVERNENLNLKEKVPLLMDSVTPPATDPDPVELEHEEPSPQQELVLPEASERPEEIQDEFDFGAVDEEERLEPTLSFDESAIDEYESAEMVDEVIDDDIQPEEEFESSSSERADYFANPPELDMIEPEEVIVLNVMAEEDGGFEGEQLLQILLACGMRFGAMDIFHRTDDQGRIQFSMANVVKPGTFDLDGIAADKITGVSFFMTLPCASNAMEAFDYMHETANVVSRHLHGQMRDEMHSVMTAQTVEHCRSRIREFARSQLINA